MSNSFGSAFRLTTFGESHGKAIGGVIDGCPSGLNFDESLITSEMARRHEGDATTQRKEPDIVEILSGVFRGKTLGTPIAFIIRNSDARSDDYKQLEQHYRPGHADYTTMMRYGIRDHRGGGRASGRETAARVAAGAIAKMFLYTKGIDIKANIINDELRQQRDTVVHNNVIAFHGGIIECHISGLSAGFGNPIFGRLNAMLAAAMMSIPSAIGFEMGCGFQAANMTGEEYRDEWNEDFSTVTNHCGGIQGGISNGMPIVFRTAFHPVVTTLQPTRCIDTNGKIEAISITGRHDQWHLPRTIVIVEAMAALTIADTILNNQR